MKRVVNWYLFRATIPDSMRENGFGQSDQGTEAGFAGWAMYFTRVYGFDDIVVTLPSGNKFDVQVVGLQWDNVFNCCLGTDLSEEQEVVERNLRDRMRGLGLDDYELYFFFVSRHNKFLSKEVVAQSRVYTDRSTWSILQSLSAYADFDFGIDAPMPRIIEERYLAEINKLLVEREEQEGREVVEPGPNSAIPWNSILTDSN